MGKVLHSTNIRSKQKVQIYIKIIDQRPIEKNRRRSCRVSPPRVRLPCSQWTRVKTRPTHFLRQKRSGTMEIHRQRMQIDENPINWSVFTELNRPPDPPDSEEITIDFSRAIHHQHSNKFQSSLKIKESPKMNKPHSENERTAEV